ncbi:hypothetical protein [Scytonema millei]|nr:hypothetical protein [Scytonema millei]
MAVISYQLSVVSYQGVGSREPVGAGLETCRTGVGSREEKS